MSFVKVFVSKLANVRKIVLLGVLVKTNHRVTQESDKTLLPATFYFGPNLLGSPYILAIIVISSTIAYS